MSLFKIPSWILPLILLAGCDDMSHHRADNIVSHSVALPALPIIQGAVMALVPTVAGQRNDLMMRQVCELARGESSQEQVSQTLRQQGIELNNIPQQGHPLSLLVNPDRPQRVTACAAYIATSVMTLPKTSEFMVEAKAEAAGTIKTTALVVDPQKLNRFLDVQLAVAKADAELFALIATELEKSLGLTLEQYNQNAQSLFAAIAPAYLQRVKELYASGQGTDFTLLEYSDSDFKFRSNSGYLFEYGYDGLNLSMNRTPWYGEGKLLGKIYLLDTAYLAPELIKNAVSTNSALRTWSNN
ncbi:hypothetical protein BFW87_00470 [Pseudomonas fluorescens]|uniref:Lipoprotein n=1 Tax=Pseudomonas fluorescens TaxID=294 RepID=A0A1T2Z9E1_PSEFL|nr:hypothetical protein [Pseudomonas fluorescens]OPB00919.1 hypothetical protein BFW87_00470 [Pseudomonas fluorescens]